MARTVTARTRQRTPTIAEIVALYDDPERCATAAGLRYVSLDEPGIRRQRRGRGFRYLDPAGQAIAPAERERIVAMAIPPAWRDVWICIDANGHVLAVGADERERRQYLYHDQWRTFRDLLNFYRLADFGARLPAIRSGIEGQLRRRTLDRDLVLATMLRIIDACGIRVGSELYAVENESYGLSTLTKKHVQVHGGTVEFRFPAKSGRTAAVTLADPAVARVVAQLTRLPGRRLFSLAGLPVDADAVNDRLGELAGARVTAKDFRTWHGTRIAFGTLRRHLPPGADAEAQVLDAVDAAADFLGNTRAVARAHYVHPHVVGAYLDGTFTDLLAARRPVRAAGLDADERAQLAFLRTLLERLGLDTGG